jgi:hypothetical protein
MVEVYWIFKKVGDKLIDLKDCIFAFDHRDAQQVAQSKYKGTLYTIKDKICYPEDYCNNAK